MDFQSFNVIESNNWEFIRLFFLGLGKAFRTWIRKKRCNARSNASTRKKFPAELCKTCSWSNGSAFSASSSSAETCINDYATDHIIFYFSLQYLPLFRSWGFFFSFTRRKIKKKISFDNFFEINNMRNVKK